MRSLDALELRGWYDGQTLQTLKKNPGQTCTLSSYSFQTYNLAEAKAIRDWLGKFIEDCEAGV